MVSRNCTLGFDARAFDVFEDGTYYIGRPGADRQCPILFCEFTTGVSRLVTNIETEPTQPLSVIPDRRTILVCKSTTPGVPGFIRVLLRRVVCAPSGTSGSTRCARSVTDSCRPS